MYECELDNMKFQRVEHYVRAQDFLGQKRKML